MKTHDTEHIHITVWKAKEPFPRALWNLKMREFRKLTRKPGITIKLPYLNNSFG